MEVFPKKRLSFEFLGDFIPLSFCENVEKSHVYIVQYIVYCFIFGAG